jgi:hypothetical protein
VACDKFHLGVSEKGVIEAFINTMKLMAVRITVSIYLKRHADRSNSAKIINNMSINCTLLQGDMDCSITHNREMHYSESGKVILSYNADGTGLPLSEELAGATGP